MEPLVFNRNREINLTKSKLGIGWAVPLRVAERWDPDYELMRVVAMFEFLELGKYAVMLDSVSIELSIEKFKGEDGKWYRRATSTAQVYDLSELPDHLKARGRELCHAMNGLPVIRFMLLGPVSRAQPVIELGSE